MVFWLEVWRGTPWGNRPTREIILQDMWLHHLSAGLTMTGLVCLCVCVCVCVCGEGGGVGSEQLFYIPLLLFLSSFPSSPAFLNLFFLTSPHILFMFINLTKYYNHICMHFRNKITELLCQSLNIKKNILDIELNLSYCHKLKCILTLHPDIHANICTYVRTIKWSNAFEEKFCS